jgi:hypothetical protein
MINGFEVYNLMDFGVEPPDDFGVNRWEGYLIATWHKCQGMEDSDVINLVRDAMHELEAEGLVVLHGAQYYPPRKKEVYSSWFEFTPYAQALIVVIAYEQFLDDHRRSSR